MRVTNCYRPTLDQFQQRFGGSVYVHKQGDEKARLQWVWRVNGRVADTALREMLPHLREKASQAACALALRDLPKGPVRDGLLASLSLLKRTTHHRV